MEVTLLIISIISVVLHNTLINKVGKESSNAKSDTYVFNCFLYFVSFLIFLFITIFSGGISWYSFLFGCVFGIVTVLAGVNKMFALNIGPMYITLLICTASMIIPTISGVFFGEGLSVYKLIAILFLIIFICLASIKKKADDKKANLKWLVLCIVTFFVSGAIGVLQKVFTASAYKDQQAAFLTAAFFISFSYSFVMAARTKSSFKRPKSFWIYAILCGICVYLMNHINLYLSGVMPSQIFFPVVNGVPIVLCSVIAFTVFKEKFSFVQLIGLIGGIASLVAICIIP